jgi:hypothetical protein
MRPQSALEEAFTAWIDAIIACLKFHWHYPMHSVFAASLCLLLGMVRPQYAMAWYILGIWLFCRIEVGFVHLHGYRLFPWAKGLYYLVHFLLGLSVGLEVLNWLPPLRLETEFETEAARIVFLAWMGFVPTRLCARRLAHLHL